MAVELAQFQNDQLDKMVRKYPDSFAALATLPLQVPQAALKELERVIHNPGLRGIEIGSHVGKRELGDQALWPIYEVLEKEGWPMFIHPHQVAGARVLFNNPSCPWFHFVLAGASLANSKLAGANLIFYVTVASLIMPSIIVSLGIGLQFRLLDGVIVAGWTTANPTLYRAGLALPRWRRSCH